MTRDETNSTKTEICKRTRGEDGDEGRSGEELSVGPEEGEGTLLRGQSILEGLE